MRALLLLWRRLVGTLRGHRHDEELSAEIESHVQFMTDENVRRGMTASDARRAAMAQFGSVEAAKEAYRDQRGFPVLRDLWQDVRFSLRMLRRVPSVSVPAILVLALGIGAATALYATVYAMWLRPLPYTDAKRLVSVTTYFAGYKIDALSSPDYGTWQGTRTLGPLAAFSISNAALIGPVDTVETSRARVSGNLLDVLRVKAALGRGIQPADDKPEAPLVAMLSDALWRRQFNADASAVGRIVRIDGELHTIIGVLPSGFRMPNERPADLLTPMALSESWLRHGGGMKILNGVARLQPGVSIDEARAELSTRLAASRAQAPQVYRDDVSLRVIPLHDYVVRDARTVAIVLIGAVASILLIASANVASLLVARAAGRAREMMVRVAIGASAARIARHLLVEGLVIGVIGIAGAMAIAQPLIALAPVEDVRLDSRVVLTAIGAGMLCAMVFSLAPVLPLPRLRVRRALVVCELAVSLMLAVAAALLLENLSRLNQVAPGFRTEQLVTASVSVQGTRFAETPEELRRELRSRLQSTPAVMSVAFADAVPPTGASRISAFSRSDRPMPAAFERKDNVVIRRVEPAFFEAMSIAQLNGRVFREADGEFVAVVNRTLADRYFSGENIIGKQVDGAGLPWKTVIGVVADTRNDGLRNPTRPEIYVPLTKERQGGGGITRNNGLNVVVRTAGDPSIAVSLLRDHLRALDRSLLARIRIMDEQWQELRAAPRFQATMFGVFAGIALLMACAGIYGVLSHVVVMRRREIGIRMALGARPTDVQRMIAGEALALALGGVSIGLAGALATSRWMESLLYQVNARDPLTLAATGALVVLLAISASLIPARRASRQDPVATLRAE